MYIIKTYIYIYNCRLDDSIKLTVQAFAEIGADRWKSACEHAEKTIASMQDADNAADVLKRNLVVDLGAHTDSETDTASEAE